MIDLGFRTSFKHIKKMENKRYEGNLNIIVEENETHA